MEKIYSRTRSRLPKVKMFIHTKKFKKVYYFFIIWLEAIFSVIDIMKFITPPLEKIWMDEKKKIGTQILNDESTKVLKNVDYDDLIQVSKDGSDKISMVKSNVILINLLASDIAYRVQERLASLEKENINIPIGILTGVRIFAGSGPDMSIKVMPIGTVETNFFSEFKQARN